MRGIVLAVAACIGLTHMAHAEIVVLINGNRMDVKSYEIQTSVVVVTTWDGKVQSFPITWVDVEATKSVSHQYDPTEGIPAERLQKARRLLDGFGVADGVAALFDEVEIEIRSLRAGITRPTYDVVRGAFRNAYNGERVFDVVAADFARHADDALIDRWSQWMSQPQTQRMLSMENAEANDDDAIEASRYLAELYSDPDSNYRQELVARLDNAMLASEAGLEIATALASSLQDTRHLVLTNPPDYESLEEMRARLWPDVRKATIDSLLFTYRDASNEELTEYLVFWESEDGGRIAELMLQALTSGVEYGAEMAVHAVQAGTGGTLSKP
jgi:hypothetical protein